MTQNIQELVQTAEYELLEDDGCYFGHIPSCQGVWAHSKTLEECKKELAEVLEEWLAFKERKSH